MISTSFSFIRLFKSAKKSMLCIINFLHITKLPVFHLFKSRGIGRKKQKKTKQQPYSPLWLQQVPDHTWPMTAQFSMHSKKRAVTGHRSLPLKRSLECWAEEGVGEAEPADYQASGWISTWLSRSFWSLERLRYVSWQRAIMLISAWIIKGPMSRKNTTINMKT